MRQQFAAAVTVQRTHRGVQGRRDVASMAAKLDADRKEWKELRNGRLTLPLTQILPLPLPLTPDP